MGHWFAEVDRLLKPGGRFVVLVAQHRWDNKEMWVQAEHWRIILGWARNTSAQLTVYSKPIEHTLNRLASCYEGFSHQPTFRKHLHLCKHLRTHIESNAPNRLRDPYFRRDIQPLAACVNATGPVQNVLNGRASTFFGKLWMSLFPHAWVMNLQPVEVSEVKPKEKSIDW